MELMIQFNARHISAPELGRDFDGVGRFAYFEDLLFGDAHDADYRRCISCKEGSNIHSIPKEAVLRTIREVIPSCVNFRTWISSVY